MLWANYTREKGDRVGTSEKNGEYLLKAGDIPKLIYILTAHNNFLFHGKLKTVHTLYVYHITVITSIIMLVDLLTS